MLTWFVHAAIAATLSSTPGAAVVEPALPRTSTIAPSEPVESGGDAAERSGVRVSTTCTNCNAATLRVNGLQGDHVGVQWNGLSTTGGLADIYLLTQFSEDLVGHTAVHRGPGSVLTGDSAIGGSVEMHSISPDERQLFVRTEVGSRGWRQLLAGGTDRWGRTGGVVLVQAAGSDSVDANGDGFNDVSRFERFTYHGMFDVELTDTQRLTFGASFYGEDQEDGPGRPVTFRDIYLHEDSYFNWREFRAGWELTRPTGLHVALDGRWSRRAQQQWSPIDVGFPDSLTFATQDERWSGRLVVERPAGVATHLTGGVEWEEITLGVDVQFVLPDDPGLIRDGLRHSAAFLQVDHAAGARWSWTLGARVDHYTAFGYSEVENPRNGEITSERAAERRSSFLNPRGEVKYRPRNDVVLSAALGRGTIGPRPAFEETCCGAAYQRSLDLEPERAWALQLQAEWHPTPAQRLVVTGFHADVHDYHERIIYQSREGIPYYKKAALPRARIRGIDLIHEQRFLSERLTLGWTFTYTDSEVIEPLTLSDDADAEAWECRSWDPAALPLELDDRGSPLRYTPKHAGGVSLRWDDPRRGDRIEVDAIYTGTARHFRVGRSDESPDDYSREPCSSWGFLRSESLWLINASYERRIGRSGWTLHAGVDNVLDEVMPDLGAYESAWDWGPLQGRRVYAGATWRL